MEFHEENIALVVSNDEDAKIASLYFDYVIPANSGVSEHPIPV